MPLPDNAVRQSIDAATIFHEFTRVKAQALRYRGSLYWKQEGAYEYLVKSLPDRSQSRLGPRSPQTEQVHQDFTTRKQALTEAERLCKAVRVTVRASG